MSDDAKPVLAAALAYAAQGWRVFPCNPKTKAPLVGEDWKAAASTDPEQIRAWWRRWPRAMIGCATGHNVGAFVLDLDPLDKETGEIRAVDDMRAAVELHIGAELPASWCVVTPSGGRHLWLAPADAFMPRNARGALPPKKELPVDVRGEGGYVILPPSQRADGVAYEWLRAPAWSPLDWGAMVPLEPAPVELVDCLAERGRWLPAAPAPRPIAGAIVRAGLLDAQKDAVDETIEKYVERALAAEIRGVESAGPGTRNDALNLAALKLAQLVAAGVLADSRARVELYAAAERCGLVKDDGARSVRATIASGFKKGLRQPRDLDEIRRNAAQRAARGPHRQPTGGALRRAAPQSLAAPDGHDAGAGKPSLPPAAASEGFVPSGPPLSGGEGQTKPSHDGETVDDTTAIDRAAAVAGELDTLRRLAAPSDDQAARLAALEAIAARAGQAWRNRIEACLDLDKSDTDNARRLITYFGDNLLIMAQGGVAGGDWLNWTGTHWDLDGGVAGVHLVAQRIGDMIAREADALTSTPAELRAIDAGAAAAAELKPLEDLGDQATAEQLARLAELKAAVLNGKAARGALSKRRKTRRDNAIGAKNAGKIKAMLELAAPRLRRAPELFNADPLLVVTRSHTLRFVREIDADCPDPDVVRHTAVVDAIVGHRREDLATALVPVAYDPNATCPKWRGNIERFQPDAEQRRTVQVYAGLGLLGLPVQKVMFHYGSGGNFKSVFLEVLARVLGDSFAVGLPVETISGFGERGAGQASPDIARLFGKRFVRVSELPAGQPLKQELIKRLTGGERIPVRNFYKGYFEFTPIGKPHMSGNDMPGFDGSDGGMRRRMLAVEWPVKLPLAEQRDFEEVVRELVAEAPGILNWLIDGALDYLRNGLFIAEKVAAFTQSYIDDNDPVGQFDRDHVEAADGEKVGANEMYQAYEAWALANGKRPISLTKFGRVMKKKRDRNDSGAKHFYVNVRLHDVPARPQHGAGGNDPSEFGLQSDRASGGRAPPSHNSLDQEIPI